MTSPERQLEDELIEKLLGLKDEYRTDIRDRTALEKNFRKKLDALNRVSLTDGAFQRLLDEIVTPGVFTAAHTLRNHNAFTRDDGTPHNSHHRYDVLLLVKGVPVTQIELKTLGINPRRAIEQIVEYKNDPGNDLGQVCQTEACTDVN